MLLEPSKPHPPVQQLGLADQSCARGGLGVILPLLSTERCRASMRHLQTVLSSVCVRLSMAQSDSCGCFCCVQAQIGKDNLQNL